MICSPEIFIKAHQDVRIPYYNASYDRYVKKVEYVGCREEIGEVERFPDFYNKFYFKDKEKNDYKFCPYCGHEFNKEELDKNYPKARYN